MEGAIRDIGHGDANGHGDAKKRGKGRPHALCFAHHYRSHIVPVFYMAVQLARVGGTIVSFVSFEEELASLAADYKEELRGLDLFRFVGVRRVPMPPESSDVTADELRELEVDMMLKSFKESEIMKTLFSSMEPPTYLIVNFFLVQSKEMDLGLQIPRYVFISAGALFARFNQALESLFKQRLLRIRDDDDTIEKFDGQVHIDGLPGLSYSDLPLHLLRNPKHLRKFALRMMEADGILMNTFNGLEPGMKDVLQKYATRECQKFYAIGPVDPRLQGKGRSAQADDSDTECLRWLNSQPDESVVYICLGSLFSPKPWQIEELAVGLETSKHRFLWVVPKSKGSQDDWLPPDFEKRVQDFGYILRGWAPQLEVLSHPSIGAFLTHCGWKSFLEAVSRGVPMVTYPLDAEQHVNVRYFVDVLEIAAEIPRNSDGVSGSQSVQAAIRTVMETERGRAMKHRVKALQASLTAATAANGSSLREHHQFLEDVKAF